MTDSHAGSQPTPSTGPDDAHPDDPVPGDRPSTEDEPARQPHPDGEPPTQAARDADPQRGTPPATVLGAQQALSDSPGEEADDGTPRWDPRTQAADRQEGG